MALNINALQPRKTTMPARRGTRARDLGPNPFLNSKWAYNLKASYDNAEAYELDFTGKAETAVISKGKEKGKKTTRITGDAADAQTLLRDAAEKLGLGVSIVVTPLKGKAGWYTVKYQGQKRKAARKPKAVAATPATPITGEAPATPTSTVPNQAQTPTA